MRNTSRIILGIVVLAALSLVAETAAAQTSRVYVTNSAGDNIHVIDPATNKVVQVIDGIEAAHGIDFSPDGTRVYVSNESDSTLDVFDAKSGRLASKVRLSGHPNNIAATKDGGRVVVGIAQDPGALDVIDTKTLKVAKSIPVNGRLHNVYVTPDNKYVVTGSIRTKGLPVIDLATEKVAWELQLEKGRRPTALEAGAARGGAPHLRAALEPERLRRDRFRRAQGGRGDQAARPRLRRRRATPGLALARHRRRARWREALGDEHRRQCGLRLLAARAEAAGRGAPPGDQGRRAQAHQRGAELGHLYARQQAALHLQRRGEVGVGHRHRRHQAHRDRAGWRGTQAHQHFGPALAAAHPMRDRLPVGVVPVLELPAAGVVGVAAGFGRQWVQQ